jgi:D-glycero-alpha-D-manno-heptose-7-phosphate kinase
MKGLVEESLAVLNSGQDITAFGALLHEGWRAKRSLSAKVSNTHVDELYAHAMANGALGGKLLGAGGGGFMLLFVPPGKQSQVKEALKRFIYVPFHFDFSGSQIIFFDQEKEYSAEEKIRASQQFDFLGELPVSQLDGDL